VTFPHAHRSYGTRKQSGAQAKRALTNLLAFCTRERLAGFTPEGLAAMFNVSPQVAGEMLERARARRGVL
jgi:hypothetical protein